MPLKKILLFGIFLILQNGVSAEEKKVTKPAKPNTSRPINDVKKFDELRISDAFIWRCENNILIKTAESTQGLLMLWNNKLYQMIKVDALRGVQRYTNDANHLHWVEIPDKAMLFNFKIGQRILDYCKTPEMATKQLTAVQDDLLK